MCRRGVTQIKLGVPIITSVWAKRKKRTGPARGGLDKRLPTNHVKLASKKIRTSSKTRKANWCRAWDVSGKRPVTYRGSGKDASRGRIARTSVETTAAVVSSRE